MADAWGGRWASAPLLAVAAAQCGPRSRAYEDALLLQAAHVCLHGLWLSAQRPEARGAELSALKAALRAHLGALGSVRPRGKCPAWEGTWRVLSCVLWDDAAARLLLAPVWPSGATRSEAATAAHSLQNAQDADCADAAAGVLHHWAQTCPPRPRGLSLTQLRSETLRLQADFVTRRLAPPPRRWRPGAPVAAAAARAAAAEPASCTSRFMAASGVPLCEAAGETEDDSDSDNASAGAPCSAGPSASAPKSAAARPVPQPPRRSEREAAARTTDAPASLPAPSRSRSRRSSCSGDSASDGDAEAELEAEQREAFGRAEAQREAGRLVRFPGATSPLPRSLTMHCVLQAAIARLDRLRVTGTSEQLDVEAVQKHSVCWRCGTGRETRGGLVYCASARRGRCFGAFHADCAGNGPAPEFGKWMCPLCAPLAAQPSAAVLGQRVRLLEVRFPGTA